MDQEQDSRRPPFPSNCYASSLIHKTQMVQQALTVIAPIKSGEVEALERILEKSRRSIGESADAYFQKSPSTHFARFVILDDPDQAVDPHLLFTSNHDGSFNAYMQELVTTMGSEMDDVWQKCEGYSEGVALNATRFTEFIQKHSLKSQAFYIAYRGETVQSVLSAIKIRKRMDEILDFHGVGHKLKEVYDCLPDRLKSIADSSFVPEKKIYQDNSTQAGSSGILDLLERIIGVKYEDNDPSDRLPINHIQTARNEKSKLVEDAIVQNQMITLIAIKPDLKSKLLLRLILWLANRRAAQSKGNLSGITTIHFARWAIVDEGILSQSNQSYLLFESNYDGSWDSYIDDFIQFASTRMNLIWGNCIDYSSRGCKDAAWFKQHIRKHQFPAQVFYSAYPNLTVKNILNDLEFSYSAAQLFTQPDVKQFLSGSYHS